MLFILSFGVLLSLKNLYPNESEIASLTLASY